MRKPWNMSGLKYYSKKELIWWSTSPFNVHVCGVQLHSCALVSVCYWNKYKFAPNLGANITYNCLKDVISQQLPKMPWYSHLQSLHYKTQGSGIVFWFMYESGVLILCRIYMLKIKFQRQFWERYFSSKSYIRVSNGIAQVAEKCWKLNKF